jgi:hypothetical protein
MVKILHFSYRCDMFLRLDESQNLLFTDIKGAIDYGSTGKDPQYCHHRPR